MFLHSEHLRAFPLDTALPGVFPLRATYTRASSDSVHRASVCILLLLNHRLNAGSSSWFIQYISIRSSHVMCFATYLGLTLPRIPCGRITSCFLMPALKAVLKALRFRSHLWTWKRLFARNVSGDNSCFRLGSPRGGRRGGGRTLHLGRAKH